MIFKYVPYVTVAHVFWRRWKLWVFWKKECFFFSKEHLKVFRNTKHWYFPVECLSKVFVAYAIFKRSKFEFFRKKIRLLRKNPWKISWALFGIFFRDCVSDIHIASEFSKQSNFWFVWRNRCRLWKDTVFSPKSENVAFFL